MPLLTPACDWCGVKWLKYPRYRSLDYETYRPPATSTRWNSVHLHYQCAAEFMTALAEEFPEECEGGLTPLHTEFKEQRGVDGGHNTVESYGDNPVRKFYVPAFIRRLGESK